MPRKTEEGELSKLGKPEESLRALKPQKDAADAVTCGTNGHRVVGATNPPRMPMGVEFHHGNKSRRAYAVHGILVQYR